MDFGWPAFVTRPQGDTLADWQVTFPSSDPDAARRFLYLCGPDEVAHQVELLEPFAELTPIMDPDRRKRFSHRFVLPDGVSRELEVMLDLLKEILTLRRFRHIDVSLALDLYKIPEEGVDPYHWDNTRAGELNRRAKYNGSSAAMKDIIADMVRVIQTHPLLSQVTALVTVPGSKGDGNSFGERLAHAIAVETQLPFAKTTCPSGPREAAKTGAGVSEGLFELPYLLDGAVLIIDDVVMSGRSMSTVAQLARGAGAEAVYAFAGVKTLKNS